MKNEKQLIMVGIHEETTDNNGKIITPASIVKIYEDYNVDCFNDNHIASCEQIYARRNKKIDYKKIKIDDFKGAKGIKETFYDVSSIKEYIEMLMDDDYRMIRITKHKENQLAEDLFSHTMSYHIRKVSFNGNGLLANI